MPPPTLSVGASTFVPIMQGQQIYHPWRELKALTHVVVHFVALTPGVWGVTDGRRRIWLDSGLGQAERRCALAHELEHIRRGHHGCQPPSVEASVHAAAARRLVPDVHHLADAVVWARGNLAVAAEELWVDEHTLRARLNAAHPAEKAIISERMEEMHQWH